MLKKRIIPCLTIKDLRLVKSVRFAEHRNIGSYIGAARVFNARDVDEMVVLDLDARTNGIKSWLITEITKECFMPLSVGGGVKTVRDVGLLLRLGADKVVMNSAALERPSLITEAAGIFGSQCIVISIDVRADGNGYEVFAHGGTVGTGRAPADWARQVEELGAGEIFLTSIDRDGTMEGYDVELVRNVTQAVKIPVIACGGAGNLDDFVSVIEKGYASAAAAASIFQYTQTTSSNIRKHLAKFGVETRT